MKITSWESEFIFPQTVKVKHNVRFSDILIFETKNYKLGDTLGYLPASDINNCFNGTFTEPEKGTQK